MWTSLGKLTTEASKTPSRTRSPSISRVVALDSPVSDCAILGLKDLTVGERGRKFPSKDISHQNDIELRKLMPTDREDESSPNCTARFEVDAMPSTPDLWTKRDTTAPFSPTNVDNAPLPSGASANCSCSNGKLANELLQCSESTDRPAFESAETLFKDDAHSRLRAHSGDVSLTGDASGFTRTGSHGTAFRLSGNVALCACSCFFVKFVRYTLVFWLPFFLCRHGSLSVASAGLSSMIFDVGGIVGAITGGVVADRLLGGKRRWRSVLFISSTFEFTFVQRKRYSTQETSPRCFNCVCESGRRLSLAALMCVAAGICLMSVALCCQQLSHSRLSGEALLLEEQLAFQSLQRTLQEDWSRLNEGGPFAVVGSLKKNHSGAREGSLDLPRQQASHRRHSPLNHAETDGSKTLQDMTEAQGQSQWRLAEVAWDATSGRAQDSQRKNTVPGVFPAERLLSRPFRMLPESALDGILASAWTSSDQMKQLLFREPKEEPPERGGSDAGPSPKARRGLAAALSTDKHSNDTVSPSHVRKNAHRGVSARLPQQQTEGQEELIAALLKSHERKTVALKSEFEAKASALKKEQSWKLAQLLGYLLLVGLFNAVPDSVLGASAAQDLLELPGATKSNVAAVAAFINAIGALGALCQVRRSHKTILDYQCRTSVAAL